MISEIVSAIDLGRHKLTPWGVVSVLIFVGVIFAVYAAEASLIIGVVKSKRRGQGIPKRFRSAARDNYSFAGDSGSDLFFIRVFYRAILGRG